MKRVYLFIVFLFLLSTTFTAFSAEKFIVVIDAGHGGRDGGAVRGTYKEKDINLNVALALGRLIEANMNDVKVVYTRKSDVFVDLYKRAEIANKAKANLFISIHTNSTAAKTTTASGADTYILGLARSEENLAVAKRENSVILLEDNYSKRYEGFDPNSPESNIIFEFMTDKYMEQSLQFASNVQNGFSKVAKRVDRGVLQAGFLVLRESSMPSVLIELGFINNPAEAKYLTSSMGQRAMASSIYTGLEAYKKEFDKKQGRSASSAVAPAPKKETRPVVANNTPKNNPDATDTVVQGDKPSVSKNMFVSKNKDVEKLNQNNNKSPKQQAASDRKDTAATSPKKATQAVPVQPVPVKESTKVPAGAVEYRVQFLTSASKLPNNSPAFKGLSPVNFYKDGSTYKYTYGSTTNDAEAARLLKQAKAKFGDAFIVRFKNNVRIK